MLEIMKFPTSLVFVYFLIFFIVAQVIKNNSIVDIGWGMGFVLIAISTLIVNQSFYPRSILVTILVTLWGGRLAYHIINRIGVSGLYQELSYKYSCFKGF